MYESVRAVVGFMAVAFLVAPLNSDAMPRWLAVSVATVLVLSWLLLARVECSHRPRKPLNKAQQAAARLAPGSRPAPSDGWIDGR